MIYHDEAATRLELYDASHRELDLVHFAGRGTLTMRLRDSRHKEARIDGWIAQQLAFCFDHFARHGKLPISFPEPDYMI